MNINEKDRLFIEEIIKQNKWRKAPVLPILHKIHKQYGYLPPEILKYTALCLNIPLAQIYSTATFYHLFSTKPQGKYVIYLCDNFVCHIKKSENIIKTVQNYLGINIGETTPDGLFTLKTTSCIGQCDKAPVMMINEEIYVNLTPQKVIDILEKYKTGGE